MHPFPPAPPSTQIFALSYMRKSGATCYVALGAEKRCTTARLATARQGETHYGSHGTTRRCTSESFGREGLRDTPGPRDRASGAPSQNTQARRQPRVLGGGTRRPSA